MARSWKDRQSVATSGARKWGNGINPIHATRDNYSRSFAPDGVIDLVPSQIVTETDELGQSSGETENFGGYMLEDTNTVLWGYGVESGTALRPSLGETDDEFRRASRTKTSTGKKTFYPTWGRRKNGVPGGSHIRADSTYKGMDYTSKLDYAQPMMAGQVLKEYEPTEMDSVDSDPSQLYVQTSDVQLHKVREGSQAQAGRESQQLAPIPSRVVGMKLPSYGGTYRHAEMSPRQLSPDRVKPFWVRSAGTGKREWMLANANQPRIPLNRVPPDEPYAGRDVTGSAQFITDSTVHGYTDEDVVY